jgi:hypothetical protein
MKYRFLFVLAAAAFLVPGQARAQLASDYYYQRAAVGPGEGMYVGQRSGGMVAGPFGAAGGMSRSGSYVAPSGATVDYAERSGAVVGPLGGMRAGSASYVHAESADHGITYSRYSRSGTAVGPYGGAPVGPYGVAGYRRSGAMFWP